MIKYLVPVLGIIVGSAAGYLYWQEVGCSSGTCIVTSKPVNSTIYGAVMGYSIFDLVYNLVKKR